MSGKYPDVVTPADLQRLSHITDEEILRDIAETQREIAQYQDLHEAEAKIARAHPEQSERRIADFKSRARRDQIAEREAFIGLLHRLQTAREADRARRLPAG